MARSKAAEDNTAKGTRHPVQATRQDRAVPRERTPAFPASKKRGTTVTLQPGDTIELTLGSKPVSNTKLPRFKKGDVVTITVDANLEGEPGVRSSLVGRVERWLRQTLDQMSDAEVLKAVEAQSPAETIAEILAATPETRSASDGDWADLLLRGAESKREITDLVGGLLTSSQAAKVLRISIPGVKQRMDRRKLLAVPLPGGQWGFPALQFEEGGRVRAGIAEVAKAGADVNPWVLLSILVDDVRDGSGGMLLERLGEAPVLADVLSRLASYGEHVAA